MIAFSCHNCGKQFTLKPEFAGRATTCSSCKQSLVVPAPDETMAPGPIASETVAPAVPVKITFACTKCAMKFSVKAEFAGRSTRCPTCKEPLTVPAAEQTIAYVPTAGQLPGAPSSLARAGVDGGVTLQGGVDAASTKTSLQNLMDGKSNDAARYVIESELARGGMGAVLRAVDCDIHREVAVKYLLDQSNPNSKIRFIEEAQITGQLEHPNIVPIHELGVDAKKRIFFSMKMVKGRSLAQIVKAMRNAGEPSRVSDRLAATGPIRSAARQDDTDYSLGRLLNIFVNVCNGLAYAHSRGVVHRDLKPANIMVGDFGEVYVMDWGLAKVLKQGAATPDTGPVMAIPVATLAGPAGPFDFSAAPLKGMPLAIPVASVAPSSGSDKVVTSRELDADLTREGSVLGTPVYMPPEQATGQIHDIDERSDVYSMGAILYEILTLQPPIDKAGGFPAIVQRVTQGNIEPPEKKNPAHARAGDVPPELAAVAMKALALRREDRYQSIELLRQDVERFMEGRSVSAKHDTVREAVVKLVKRNKGASIAAAAASFVLGVVALWSLVAILGANARTQKAYDDYRAEQVAKREQAKKSVSAFVRAARLLMHESKFDDAMAQVDTALFFDENEVEARFLRAQMLIAKQDYKAAQAEFQTCVRLKPNHAGAKNLADLCARTSPEHSGDLLALADELGRQKAFTLADRVTQQAEKLLTSRTELLGHYQERLEAAWPGLGSALAFDDAGNYTLKYFSRPQVKDLAPLQGMKLAMLVISDCPVKDLAPLEGMMLTELHIMGCPIKDLTPLKGMPLASLNLDTCREIRDLTPLQGMALTTLKLTKCVRITDLTPLKGMRLTSLDLRNCDKLSDLTPLQDMPLTTLNLYGCTQLRDLKALQGMSLITLNLQGCTLVDLTPLKGMPLTQLDLSYNQQLRDLAPLKGMPLTNLNLNTCFPKDLAPLKGMPLATLNLSGQALENLDVLKGLPLKSLTLYSCNNIADLAPLKGMKLTTLSMTNCMNISELTPLAGMQLENVAIPGCPVRDLSPLKGMPIKTLDLKDCSALHDLTPLAGLSLTHLTLPPRVTKGMDGVRKMETLLSIDGENPETFWKKGDARKVK